jgi:hypothetical protein
MNDEEAGIFQSLALLVARVDEDWDDVVARSGALTRARRRRRSMIALSLAALLLGSGATIALGSRVFGWFSVSTSREQAPTLPQAGAYVLGRALHLRDGRVQLLSRSLFAPLLGEDAVLAVGSPDGRYLAYHSWSDETPELYLHDTMTGRERLLARGAQTAAWSGDGRIAYFRAQSLPYSGRNGAYVGDIVVRTPAGLARVWTRHVGEYDAVAWADRLLIVAVRPCSFPNCGRDPAPGIYVLGSNGSLRSLHLEAFAALSPDGRYAVGSYRPVPGDEIHPPNLRVVRVASGEPIATLQLARPLAQAGWGSVPPRILGGSWLGDEIVVSVAGGSDSALVFLSLDRRVFRVDSVIRVPKGTLPDARWGVSLGVPSFSRSTQRVLVTVEGQTEDDRFLIAVLACSRTRRSCVRGTLLRPRAWFALVQNPSRPA